MEDIETYARHLSSGRDAFARRFTDLYLFKVISTSLGAKEDPDSLDPPSFRTGVISIGAARASDLGAIPTILPITKRRASFWSDRISVGRAPNCDIVLRVPYVSKLHAHFTRDEKGETSLTDAGSANGTFINEVRLTPQKRTVVTLGDTVRFGSLLLELVDGGRLFDKLSRLPSNS